MEEEYNREGGMDDVADIQESADKHIPLDWLHLQYEIWLSKAKIRLDILDIKY